ncbi:hypothetical protein D9619_004561 [Psilocybe cf. subviscida]|uniref:Uncharacterized protein n=1 Tax=Psilocybe cf. subviscida TaxID=2480587 RepID=A0A8H5F8L3_9AGAR|nr:hypothetical protein D9619_004561 [Psilocybe cf. subviscida]
MQLDGTRRIYTGVLILLFSMIITNLAATWKIARSILVVHDESRDTMAVELFTGSVALTYAANATGCIAILIADLLLCWRCYILWQKNKWMLGAFTLFLLGEVALIPILLVLNANLGPGQVSIICLYFFISIGITVLATALIIYRVIDVSRRSTGQTKGRYQYTIEIAIESGAMYSITLLIAGVLLAVRGKMDGPNYSITQAASYWGGILTPVTGIAPTLIASRISSGRARDEKQWSQPMSGVSVPRRHTGDNVVLTTLHGTGITVDKVSTTDVENRGETFYSARAASGDTKSSFELYNASS